MKTRIVGLLFALIAVVAMNSCADAQPSASGNSTKDLTAQEFKKGIEQNGISLVDIRTASEYASGHLKGATLIDWYGTDFKEKVSKLDKSQPIYIYCASGGRSTAAKDVLMKLGFKEVHQLTGGIGAWKSSGYSVEK